MRRRSRNVGLAAVALLVAVSFVVRRTGILPDGPLAFDPSDFADAPVVEAMEADEMVGREAVVCGTVVNAVFASATGGQPTYLNLERAYPEQPFDAVIWGRDRVRFHPPPEVAYRDRRICVSGRITTHQGTPRIEVRSPQQIRVEEGR